MDDINEAENGRARILMDFHKKYKNKCPWNSQTCCYAAEKHVPVDQGQPFS